MATVKVLIRDVPVDNATNANVRGETILDDIKSENSEDIFAKRIINRTNELFQGTTVAKNRHSLVAASLAAETVIAAIQHDAINSNDQKFDPLNAVFNSVTIGTVNVKNEIDGINETISGIKNGVYYGQPVDFVAPQHVSDLLTTNDLVKFGLTTAILQEKFLNKEQIDILIVNQNDTSKSQNGVYTLTLDLDNELVSGIIRRSDFDGDTSNEIRPGLVYLVRTTGDRYMYSGSEFGTQDLFNNGEKTFTLVDSISDIDRTNRDEYGVDLVKGPPHALKDYINDIYAKINIMHTFLEKLNNNIQIAEIIHDEASPETITVEKDPGLPILNTS